MAWNTYNTLSYIYIERDLCSKAYIVIIVQNVSFERLMKGVYV